MNKTHMSPLSYAEPTFLQREVGARLIERLELIRLQPQRILDLGCGAGGISEVLLQKYRKAEVTSLDITLSDVQKIRQCGGWLRKPMGVCANVARLPFKADCIDMAVSNLMLQWCSDLPAVFGELAQVIRPEGLLLFSTLGPDTLHELRTSQNQVNSSYRYAGHLVDMHDVGDALLQAGFRDPVVDMEVITLTYADMEGLLWELGDNSEGRMRSVLPEHSRSRLEAVGEQQVQRLCQAYQQFQLPDGQYPATYEVIYGHAWAPTITPSAKPARYIPIRPD